MYTGGMHGQGRFGGMSATPAAGRHRRAPQGYKRSDERIRENICDRLMEMDDLDPSNISVQVTAGEVTLEGSVDDRRAKYIVEELAESILGVQDVNNRLRIRREFDSSSGNRNQGSRPESGGGGGGGERNRGGRERSQYGSSSTSGDGGSSRGNGGGDGGGGGGGAGGGAGGSPGAGGSRST
jgi:hypothetical protein